MPSVAITTKVVSSNHAHGEVYSIQHYMIIVCQLLAVDQTFSPGANKSYFCCNLYLHKQTLYYVTIIYVCMICLLFSSQCKAENAHCVVYFCLVCLRIVSCVWWCPTHIVLSICFVFVLFVSYLVSCVHKVASFSGLSILDDPFRFL